MINMLSFERIIERIRERNKFFLFFWNIFFDNENKWQFSVIEAQKFYVEINL